MPGPNALKKTAIQSASQCRLLGTAARPYIGPIRKRLWSNCRLWTITNERSFRCQRWRRTRRGRRSKRHSESRVVAPRRVTKRKVVIPRAARPVIAQQILTRPRSLGTVLHLACLDPCGCFSNANIQQSRPKPCRTIFRPAAVLPEFQPGKTSDHYAVDGQVA